MSTSTEAAPGVVRTRSQTSIHDLVRYELGFLDGP
jgi:hypothetical protein